MKPSPKVKIFYEPCTLVFARVIFDEELTGVTLCLFFFVDAG